MIKANDISRIKSGLSDHIGRKVQLTAKRGRKKALVRMGVLESTYPSIFTVKLDAVENIRPERVVSFSYADILTHAVEINVFGESNTDTAVEPA